MPFDSDFPGRPRSSARSNPPPLPPGVGRPRGHAISTPGLTFGPDGGGRARSASIFIPAAPGQGSLPEVLARREIDRQREQNLKEMFGGTQLVTKVSAQAKQAADLAGDAKKAAAEVRNAFARIDLPTVEIPFPNLAIPGFRIPSLELPDVNLPSFSLPDIDLPGIDLPHLNLPNINLPHLNLPGVNLPGVNLPGVNLPGIDLPNLGLPRLNLPGIGLPGFGLPGFGLPGFDLGMWIPDLRWPSLALPSIEIPGLGSIDLNIPGMRSVLQLLMDLFDFDLGTIVVELGAEFILEWIAAALPVLGQISSGAKAASEWGKAAHKGYQIYKVSGQKKVMLAGDPRIAADAVRVLLQRAAAQHAGKATIKTAQFVTSTAGLALDFGALTGPLVSTASALATLSLKVHAFGVAHREKVAGNVALQNPERLDAQIFGVSPILGCYLLTCSNTSDVINILTSEIGARDWNVRAEAMKRKIDPLLTEATKFIRSSPYELQGLKSNKGTFAKKKKGFFW